MDCALMECALAPRSHRPSKQPGRLRRVLKRRPLGSRLRSSCCEAHPTLQMEHQYRGMTGFAALEISLRRGLESGTHAVELRFSMTGSDADELSLREGVVRFDLGRLRLLAEDINEYGRVLAQSVLA